jgi:hypothetical protein
VNQLQAAVVLTAVYSRGFSENFMANSTEATAAVTSRRAVVAKPLHQPAAKPLHQRAAKLLHQVAVVKSLQILAASQHVIITWPAC